MGILWAHIAWALYRAYSGNASQLWCECLAGNTLHIYHILYTHKLNSPTGFPCEEHENPADYFLDVVNRCEKRTQLTEAEGQLLVCVRITLTGVYTLLLCRLRGHMCTCYIGITILRIACDCAATVVLWSWVLMAGLFTCESNCTF